MIEYTDDTLRAAINQIAATDEGKVFFAAMKDHCKWDQTYTSTENAQVTQYHAAVRGVYGGIRSMMRPEHLKEIEFNYKRKVDNDRPSTRSNPTAKRSTRAKQPTSK